MITLAEETSKPPQRRGETERDADDAAPERSSVEWDGSRAEIVADETEEFEDQQTGVQLSYTLKKPEIEDFFKKSRKKSDDQGGIYSIQGNAVFAALFLIYAAIPAPGDQTIWRVLSLLVGIAAGVIFVVRLLRRKPEPAANEKTAYKIRLSVYPDHIETERGGRETELPLDGSFGRVVTDHVIALYPPEKDGEKAQPEVLLPLRCVDPNVLPEVQAMIFAGTHPIHR